MTLGLLTSSIAIANLSGTLRESLAISAFSSVRSAKGLSLICALKGDGFLKVARVCELTNGHAFQV